MYFGDKKSENSRSALSHLKAIRYWHRPCGGLVEVIKKMKERGVFDPTLLDKAHMELYIGSLLGIALQESEGIDFWIGKPNEDPPDMAFMTIVSDENNRIFFHSREVEITRCLSQDNDIIGTVLKKDKFYPGDYIIVCFLEFTGAEDIKMISNKLIAKLKNIQHVFLVFHGMPFADLKESIMSEEVRRKVTVAQVSPVFSSQVIDIVDSLEKWKLDDKRLIYTDKAKVYYGLRDGDKVFPKIITN
ncbi:MAG: hypothetical protein AAB667_02250 [Patescibacteria group bacterium]